MMATWGDARLHFLNTQAIVVHLSLVWGLGLKI